MFVCHQLHLTIHEYDRYCKRKNKQSVEYSIAATESADKGKVQGLQQAGLKDQ